jgi:hypothetical protein
LAETEAAVVNVLSASSSLFTLLLAAVFPSEPGTELSKCDQILFGSGFGKKT